MVFTREDAARAAQNIGIDFKKEAFQLEDLLNGMNTELARHGTKAGTADVTHDDPTMTAKLAVANLRVSPSYYSQRVGKSAWERSLARGVKHKGAKTEYKTVEFELEGFDDKEGTFSGYGAVFSNIDSGGDIIEPGAFTKTIAEGIGRVKILSGHNDSLLPIGIPTELREDAKGLFMSAKISDTTLGRDVKTLIHDGVLCELSIGYDPVVFDYDENGIRHLREVKLWEISVVTWAMNEQAVITDHKSDDAATRIEAEAQAIVTEVKAGRKISASRMKSLKDACTSIQKILSAADAVSGININLSSSANIPHNADGTDDFEGGWTHINERGGEMAYLPSGTAIIPADKTDEIINNSTSSSSVTYEDHSTFSPTISITLGGETTKADAEEIVRRVKQAMEDFWQEKKEEEYHERTLQGAYAQ